MDIAYTDIYDMCQDLSSFEGRRITNASGESMYSDVHITTQDEPFVRTFVDEAVSLVHSATRYAIRDVTRDTTKITLTPTAGSVLETSVNAKKVLTETLSMFVMRCWLEDKSAERSKAYGLMFDSMLASFVRLTYRKNAPNLSDY